MIWFDQKITIIIKWWYDMIWLKEIKNVKIICKFICLYIYIYIYIYIYNLLT